MKGKQQSVYTIIEILLMIWALFVISLFCRGLYVAWHFISKFW